MSTIQETIQENNGFSYIEVSGVNININSAWFLLNYPLEPLRPETCLCRWTGKALFVYVQVKKITDTCTATAGLLVGILFCLGFKSELPSTFGRQTVAYTKAKYVVRYKLPCLNVQLLWKATVIAEGPTNHSNYCHQAEIQGPTSPTEIIPSAVTILNTLK